jgi:TonB family protein
MVRRMKKPMLIFTILFATPALAGAPEALTKEEINKGISAGMPDVKACMKQHGEATGRLVVHFVIKPDGKSSDSKAQESSSNAALDKCIVQAFGKMSFAKPRDGQPTPIAYPLQFAPPKKAKVGHLEEKQIVDTVHGKLAEVQACYDDAQEDNPKLAGTVQVGLVISPDGKVTEAKVLSSDTKSTKLDDCVVKKTKGWLFPKPTGGGEAAVSYPFTFAQKR